jgi:hypothetical protein
MEAAHETVTRTRKLIAESNRLMGHKKPHNEK